MDIVYASLVFRHPGEAPHAHQAAEAADALWAHALPGVGLQHVSAHCHSGRVDFLLYLMSPDSPGTPGAEVRAHALITYGQRISPVLNRRYLPPGPLTEQTNPAG
ncbi:hypothetical protein [Streptomyces sp. NPDC091259]|uniref:hypothetical protein n=1 Tax=Streptomyces sp. NPDC091259 TaxID=3365976 RepID=UPI00380D427C